jgi:hypothetical protein
VGNNAPAFRGKRKCCRRPLNSKKVDMGENRMIMFFIVWEGEVRVGGPLPKNEFDCARTIFIREVGG